MIHPFNGPPYNCHPSIVSTANSLNQLFRQKQMLVDIGLINHWPALLKKNVALDGN